MTFRILFLGEQGDKNSFKLTAEQIYKIINNNALFSQFSTIDIYKVRKIINAGGVGFK
jgi:hypothetical protein